MVNKKLAPKFMYNSVIRGSSAILRGLKWPFFYPPWAEMAILLA
uniref:Uncharacterized protein n=1 Tax=Arundo donax TaxID=35708 RepID=A0A0A9FKW1_ARUDO